MHGTDPILIVGAPRSGTTWLAKIIDSHPDVLYRHEPDGHTPCPMPLDAAAIPPLLQVWTADRSPRAAGKRPFFPKSYRRPWQTSARRLLANGLAASGHLPLLSPLSRLPLPEWSAAAPPRVALKSIRLAEAAALFAAALPAARVVFILRHPCGQVASVMRGAHQGRFDLATRGTDMPFDEAATISFAAAQGVDASTFQSLPDAGKYAWAWRAVNEPAVAGLRPLANARVIRYEDLCATPVEQAQHILAFCKLNWHVQTAAFVAQSTSRAGAGGYYSVFRNTVAAANAWRQTMPPEDQAAVMQAVADSPLMRDGWSSYKQVTKVRNSAKLTM